MSWLKRLFNRLVNTNSTEEISNSFNETMQDIRDAGSTAGKHYTDHIETIKQLKREGKNQEAIVLLLDCVEATESQSEHAGEGWGVAPWYYEQLAILYRKERQFDKEVKILERYDSQPKAPGAGPKKLAERLVKARTLLNKHTPPEKMPLNTK
ncbi:hypothetical protein [Neptuniibacter halophilus]|uniref:hypothetical protein n=1 Tax=Neptuniibacter halophilus TaxID=651666 RepID=UPI002572AAED|nr:hypothetical protein [Neptuniibacter halophilus]